MQIVKLPLLECRVDDPERFDHVGDAVQFEHLGEPLMCDMFSGAL